MFAALVEGRCICSLPVAIVKKEKDAQNSTLILRSYIWISVWTLRGCFSVSPLCKGTMERLYTGYMCSRSVDTFSCTSKEKQTKIIYTNVYVRRWGQTTPQRSDQSVTTFLVNLELLCFNSFLTKLGLKIRNIRPIKMAHRITPNVKL